MLVHKGEFLLFSGLNNNSFDERSESSKGSLSSSNRTLSVADSGYMSDCMSPKYSTPMPQLGEPMQQTVEPLEFDSDLSKSDGFGYSQRSMVETLASLPNPHSSNNLTNLRTLTKPLIPLTCEENTLPVKVDRIEPVEILVPRKDYDLNNNFLENTPSSLAAASRDEHQRGSRGHITGTNNRSIGASYRGSHANSSGKGSLNDAVRGSRQGQQQKTPAKRGRKLGQGKVPKI